MNLLTQNMKPHVSHDKCKGIPNGIVGCNPFPTMGARKKASGSVTDLGAHHKCNESNQKLKDEGGPSWCATRRRYFWSLYKKLERLGE
jgi:hypothetical protein